MNTPPATASSTTQSAPLIAADSYVTLHYRITLQSGAATGQVFADTFTGRPATLQMGSGQWAPGLETALVGLAEGSRTSYTLAPAQAYGDRNPDLVQKLTRAMVLQHAGPDQTLTAGDMVEFAAPGGGGYSGVFKGWEGDHAVFDFNHPLAGTALQIDVHILGVL